MAPSASASAPRRWPDAVVALILAVAAGFFSLAGARQVDEVLLEYGTDDVWFESDMARVFSNMTHSGGNHYRTNVHPLFSLAVYPVVRLVRAITGNGGVSATQLVVAGVAACSAVALFALLMLAGLRRLDAVLFTGLAAVSASSIFWFTVPETYPFGALSLILALGLVAAAGRRRVPEWCAAAASLLTLSFTVTNWMGGIVAAFLAFPWRRALRVTAAALCIAIVLALVQKAMFRSSGFFLSRHAGEAEYVLRPESGGPLGVARSFFLHSMVMPAFQEAPNPRVRDWPLMLTQASAAGSGSAWGAAAVGLWGGLLALGLLSLFLSGAAPPRFRLAVALVILGQLALHLLYGPETFLYSCHFGPLLVVLAAMGAGTRLRPASLALAAALLVSAGINNLQQFGEAAAFVERHGSERHLVRVAMKKRPHDPWPRGEGHVVLALPGSQVADKAYHEPGGSFSPAAGSFGVSIWMCSADGKLMATSDDLPLSKVEQSFEWEGEAAGRVWPPAIATKTPHYEARWAWTRGRTGALEGARGGEWRLRLRQPPAAGASARLSLVVRSVGPAGGPVVSLRWEGGALVINERWRLLLSFAPAAVRLGEEGSPVWLAAAAPGENAPCSWRDGRGWGYARLDLGGGAQSQWELHIGELGAASEDALPPFTPGAPPELDLPDPRFAAAIEAQVANLTMGLVGRETRSSDPWNVPVPWQRTGAYIITALAAGGELGTARELASYLAANDFYGGFGPEADAPGLGIWALAEVASRLGSRDYDLEVWPHVARKAEWIVKLLDATGPVRGPLVHAVVPEHAHREDADLIADAARNGLISGRMDWHRPVLYVNAVSYRGLCDAAALAARLGHEEDARRWRERAEGLQGAWQASFQPPATEIPPSGPPKGTTENDRTYMSALWPTWTAARIRGPLLRELEARWNKNRKDGGAFRSRPLWTYFEVAEAHQWLYLERPEKTWATVEWFWENQASPGLYTWWEDKDEGNAYGAWERVRGWVHPPSSQPHYWTNAEMLLLLLDMLAYVDLGAAEPTLVIGAGVPASWLAGRLSVRRLSTRLGRVDWTWQDGEVTVRLEGRPRPVRLGPAFPPETSVRAE